ncbi:50S ribosomal protein L5 [Candidatus Uhrbacteria bacterium RIFCSPHIGHO2_01_FULL_63_20]|uniref:Large ribosomal subunit protein uL5 n=1 Tax=Candidatus Uhrbacteria bacterium RIFCSPHIGHO2_01_FULL_63_20 TaxID=1802385 RepID=A0A1F7TNU6_9BACT|nr:MAG: 50S ribosomal protein L5 [Candidatus Uhrbacteria bacterium RIFCSPHIGHO2_01_FULL_63_20]
MALKEHYKTTVVPALKNQFGYTNVHAVPTITKVTLNVGLGKGLKDAKFLETAESTLRRIAGQAPVKTKARISISNFKIREGMVVGMKVTLRGKRMWDFLEKLVKVSIPRTRDFRGLPVNGFDGQGNYTLGFKEHIAFPEIKSDEIEVIHGLQVTINTTAKSKPEALSLLRTLGMPFEEKT